MARMTLEEIRNRVSTVDWAKVEATTEAEIEDHRAADGDADLDVPVNARVVETPRALRVRLGMTQPEMAAALSIPLGTWRNWEQGRVNLEPAAAALLRVVSHSPEVALTALAVSNDVPAHPSRNAEKQAATERQSSALAARIGISPTSTADAERVAMERIEAVLGSAIPLRPATTEPSSPKGRPLRLKRPYL